MRQKARPCQRTRTHCRRSPLTRAPLPPCATGYERNYPVYALQWNASRTGPEAYINPAAPVHILTGAAGCPENQDGWQAKGNPWSALRINDYGYGRLRALNSTALQWEYVDNKAGKVLDTMVLVKTHSGGFPPA